LKEVKFEPLVVQKPASQSNNEPNISSIKEFSGLFRCAPLCPESRGSSIINDFAKVPRHKLMAQGVIEAFVVPLVYE
jgi:uncharacterized protein YecE (DUF72 family)